MAVKKYAGLDNNYLPTDGSVPVALGSEAIELTVTSGNVSQAVSLEGYDKIAFVTEGNTNTSIDFLELLGSETTDATLEIVKDVTASSGYALKMTGIQKLVFGTRISYVPDILKKVTLKAKKDAGNTGNLYASVVSYANGQYINKSDAISIEDYVSVVDTSSLTDSYTTHIGYIKGVGTNYVEPASNPNSPSELPATTDEVALILEATGASDIWYIDVISLEEVENSIRDIPDGEGVYSSSQNFNTRNDRITTTPANPVVTTPTTYTLNGDGSIDITFTWTYTGSGDAYNIDGFSIYTHSSNTSTPPTFSDSAVYVDATTRKFTLYGITINKYYTVGVQAYRQIDHDIAVDLALSEDVIRSAIMQTTPYRPANITPSTTSYAIQRNVSSYLGSTSLGSIYIHGYYPNGMRGDIAGQILYNEGSTATDMYLAINAQAVDCTDFTYTADTEFTCYLVLNGGVVEPAIYDINTNTFMNDTETVSSGAVIGYVIVDYIRSGTVYTIQDAYVYENAKLLSMSKTTKLEEAWRYLSEATSQSDWEDRVDALGIENSFTFLAAYNAFITNLTANEGFIDSLGTKTLTLQNNGAIKSSSYSAGGEGFSIKANGEVEFGSGTFRGNIISTDASFYSGSIKNGQLETSSSSGTAYKFNESTIMNTQFNSIMSAPVGFLDTGSTVTSLQASGSRTLLNPARPFSGDDAALRPQLHMKEDNSVAVYNPCGGSPYVFYSTNGVNWYPAAEEIFVEPYTECYISNDNHTGYTPSKGLFWFYRKTQRVWGNNFWYYHKIYRSTDGINWSYTGIPSDWPDQRHSGTLYYLDTVNKWILFGGGAADRRVYLSSDISNVANWVRYNDKIPNYGRYHYNVVTKELWIEYGDSNYPTKYATQDGLNWYELSIPSDITYFSNMRSVNFPDKGFGFIWGSFGGIYKIQNGTYTAINHPFAAPLYIKDIVWDSQFNRFVLVGPEYNSPAGHIAVIAFTTDFVNYEYRRYTFTNGLGQTVYNPTTHLFSSLSGQWTTDNDAGQYMATFTLSKQTTTATKISKTNVVTNYLDLSFNDDGNLTFPVSNENKVFSFSANAEIPERLLIKKDMNFEDGLNVNLDKKANIWGAVFN